MNEDGSLTICLLGGFRVSCAGRVADNAVWRLQKARSLLKLLALAPGKRLPRDQVLDLLWPDLDPDSAGNNLYQVLHAARRGLTGLSAKHTVEMKTGMIGIVPEGSVQVDVDAFLAAARAARNSGDARAFRTALDLYRGDLLPEDLYADWASARREGLRENYLSLLLDLARLHEAQGDRVAAVEILRRLVTEDATREDAQAMLLRLYAQLGQRQQALRQYAFLAQALRSELDVEPDDETRELYDAIRSGDIPPASAVAVIPAPGTRRHNIPADLTSFVGRETESAQLQELLAQSRLVTVLGPGGAGKTRLALHVARDLADRYENVRLVELTSLPDSQAIIEAVAAALGLSEQPGQPLLDGIITAIGDGRILLVLENCEHVAADCAALAQSLLRSCPHLTVLATSREALRVEGETVYGLPPLPVPPPHSDPSPDALIAYDSVRLLLDRIRYRQPDFPLTSENLRAAAEICRRLEGLPLGLELAAARAGTLTLLQIAERLSDALHLLTAGSRTAPVRQRSLRGALDGSYAPLPEEERLVFSRLATFAGGWTLASATGVAAPDGTTEVEMLDTLSHLVDCSLVMAEPGWNGTMRYRMLEPIRQYAAQQARAAGEENAIRDRHATYFLALAEQARPKLDGSEQGFWFSLLEAEHANLRTALDWLAHGDDARAGLRLAGALWLFWYIRGHLREGERWLRVMLTRSSEDTEERARALRGLGALLYKQRRFDEALDALQSALALYRARGNSRDEATCLGNIALIYSDLGNLDDAYAMHQEVLAIRRREGETLQVAVTLNNLAVIEYYRGNLAASRRLFEECLDLHRQAGDLSSAAIALNNLGQLALLEDDPGSATSAYREGLEVARDLGDMEVIAACLDGLARLAAGDGRWQRAARLHGASEALRLSMGSPVLPGEAAEHAATWAGVADSFGLRRFEGAVAEGGAWPLEDAVRFALTDEDESSDGHELQMPPISTREHEVAALVARGMTNREIARALNIGERTVETHVRRAMRKLGFASRAQLAAWTAAEHRSESARP